MSIPPTITAHRTDMSEPRASKACDIWYANSRVGARTSPKKACGLSSRACRIGKAKAAVFPLPVSASPIKSRPSRASGIDCAWIGVGALYPRAVHASQRESIMP
jgi:hypothetical protein